jgi:hypothetical protein
LITTRGGEKSSVCLSSYRLGQGLYPKTLLKNPPLVFMNKKEGIITAISLGALVIIMFLLTFWLADNAYGENLNAIAEIEDEDILIFDDENASMPDNNCLKMYNRPYDAETSTQVGEWTGPPNITQYEFDLDSLDWDYYEGATIGDKHAKIFYDTPTITCSTVVGYFDFHNTTASTFFMEEFNCWHEEMQESEIVCESYSQCDWYTSEFLGTPYCAPEGFSWTGDLCDNTPQGCTFCVTQTGCEANGLCDWVDGQLPLPDYCKYTPTTNCGTGLNAKYCITEEECTSTASGTWFSLNGVLGCHSGGTVAQVNIWDRIELLKDDPEGFVKWLFSVFDIRQKPPFSWVIEIANIINEEKEKVNNNEYTANTAMYNDVWGQITVPAKLGSATNITIATINLKAAQTTYANEFALFRTILIYISWIGFADYIIGKVTGAGSDDAEEEDIFERSSMKVVNRNRKM